MMGKPKHLKPVPKSVVVQLELDKNSLENLKEFTKQLKAGEIKHAIILYTKKEDGYYLPLTDSTYQDFGWLMQKTIIDMIVGHEGVEGD